MEGAVPQKEPWGSSDLQSFIIHPSSFIGTKCPSSLKALPASTAGRLHIGMENTDTDNGLSLGQHTLVLFVSVVFSVFFHFGMMYWFHDVGMETVTSERRQAHVTPENLPPVRIDAFVRKTELAAPAIAQKPSADAAAEASKKELGRKAEAMTPPDPAPLAAPDDVAGSPLSHMAPPPADMPTVPENYLRQQVAAVPTDTFTRKTNPSPRWTLDAAVPRIPDAPDLASSVEQFKGTPSGNLAAGGMLPPLSDGQALNRAVASLSGNGGRGSVTEPPKVPVAPPAPPPTKALVTPPAVVEQMVKPVTPRPVLKAIDERLNLSLSYYEHPSDGSRYFRLDILRRPESSLPIMPKDVLFIQDISGSIGRTRLAYSKAAMKSALFNTLRAGDRFNIFAFRDVTLTPSLNWLTFDPNTHKRADEFIDSLRARGSTDLFLLLQDLHAMKLEKNRPMIAVVITDGEPTVGITETTRIIGEFSRMNGGNIAVYAFATKQSSPYFLDMLCYTNRGENTVSSGDRERLATELAPVFDSIRNPVMKDLSVTFDAASGSEVHPQKLTHLYADRTLTIYGRVPKSTQNVTCQLRGTAAEAPYDAVFTFDFSKAVRSDANLRRAWAERAMFDLLAEYATNPSEALLKRIADFARTYGVRNPYAKK